MPFRNYALNKMFDALNILFDAYETICYNKLILNAKE
jgi:hypothetical protein